MNIARSTGKAAVAVAPGAMTAAVGGRAARWRGVLALVCLIASAAHAGDRDRDRDRERDRDAPRVQVAQPAPVRERPAPVAREGRQFDSRAAEDQRRQQVQQNPPDRSERGGNDGRRGVPRLTADERRDLRRQINEAGLDIYPNTPRR